MRYCRRFLAGIPHLEAGTHVILTRPPLPLPLRGESVRLACVRHAASVGPEPGSNSPYKLYFHISLRRYDNAYYDKLIQSKSLFNLKED